jgi:CheY-like chemotaxis protein
VGFDDALPMLDGPPRAGRVPWSFILLDQGVAEQEVPAINRHLEALPASRRPVVVLMTSLSSQQRERDLRGMGFSGTLIKPVSPVRLAAVLDGTPDRPQGIVQLALPGQEDETATPFGSGFGPSAAETDAADGEGGPGSGPLVLLAEDNPFNQKVAGSMLRLLGCRVKIAANGVEAVAMALQEDFDLVFMDCQMPAMDGYEATRRIRLLPGPRSGVRVIAMTANVMSGDRQACFAAGMDDFLSKPINKGTLAGMLEKWKITPETVSAGPA